MKFELRAVLVAVKLNWSTVPSKNGDGVSAPILLMSLSMLVMSGGIMNSISKLVSPNAALLYFPPKL